MDRFREMAKKVGLEKKVAVQRSDSTSSDENGNYPIPLEIDENETSRTAPKAAWILKKDKDLKLSKTKSKKIKTREEAFTKLVTTTIVPLNIGLAELKKRLRPVNESLKRAKSRQSVGTSKVKRQSQIALIPPIFTDGDDASQAAPDSTSTLPTSRAINRTASQTLGSATARARASVGASAGELNRASLALDQFRSMGRSDTPDNAEPAPRRVSYNGVMTVDDGEPPKRSSAWDVLRGKKAEVDQAVQYRKLSGSTSSSGLSNSTASDGDDYFFCADDWNPVWNQGNTNEEEIQKEQSRFNKHFSEKRIDNLKRYEKKQRKGGRTNKGGVQQTETKNFINFHDEFTITEKELKQYSWCHNPIIIDEIRQKIQEGQLSPRLLLQNYDKKFNNLENLYQYHQKNEKNLNVVSKEEIIDIKKNNVLQKLIKKKDIHDRPKDIKTVQSDKKELRYFYNRIPIEILKHGELELIPGIKINTCLRNNEEKDRKIALSLINKTEYATLIQKCTGVKKIEVIKEESSDVVPLPTLDSLNGAWNKLENGEKANENTIIPGTPMIK